MYILVSTLIQETDKAAYLVRQFIHFNLYDRIRYRDCQHISGHRYIHAYTCSGFSMYCMCACSLQHSSVPECDGEEVDSFSAAEST